MKVFNPNTHRNNKIFKEQEERKETRETKLKPGKFIELVQGLYFKIDNKTKLSKKKRLQLIKLLVKRRINSSPEKLVS